MFPTRQYDGGEIFTSYVEHTTFIENCCVHADVAVVVPTLRMLIIQKSCMAGDLYSKYSHTDTLVTVHSN